MNEQEYQAAKGELERLEAKQKDAPSHPDDVQEIIESLRRDIAAFEAGTRGAKPPGGHGD